ncbi:aryl-sulfate sulfotransferase [Shewanella sp. D64]|uniref:aryl-sulfate sulfotransferase n=1 Tax=unclassified Shewanella TaxID=196818 RepID=UPI0022BA1426|nr:MULTISPECIES: aryl-sulfate sulfotransferase [unclassified Shewanella]MEC4728769.1 aryl-sulfate sulfotransferase [Shewanella sp. D64]MEC4740205.1 aryl-sulfate sulfotransferase [Shewanella sp. E94]WBJ96265.1 aryl-sulfate sulfotransferase [Shewanella sp. MTB7]
MFKKLSIATAVVIALMGTTISISSVAVAAPATGMKNIPAADAPLGYLIHNPHENAPLTALVTLKNANQKLTDVSVRIHPKKGGAELTYKVSNKRILDEGGVPVFGLYPDFYNTFTISYKENGKHKTQEYKLHTPDVDMGFAGRQWSKMPKVSVEKVDKEFEDRLYFVNWTEMDGKTGLLAHNNPVGPGAFAWDGVPGLFIIDTAGDVRWYMNPYTTHDSKHYENAGYAMGMNVTKDGNMIWVQGQGWKHMSIMGRMLSEHSLPGMYSDASHEGIEIENGNVLIRAAAKEYLNNEGDSVNTVRDQILEVDKNGQLVDAWDLNEILDPYRDAALLSLDAGAVCLNIDIDKAGQQTSADDLANAPYGDIPGVGPGRNWAHVNSVDYDPVDDSIVISSRHQAAMIKIGRDKQVKWILGPKKGWTGEFASKVLTPVDDNNKKLDCDETGVCTDTNFEYSYTTHTFYKVDEKNTWTVFDNGDGRHLEQPAFPTDKYSRSVEYKINEKDMTVEQIWQYGKEELGYKGYSPVTSITKYQADKDSILSYFASAGLFGIGGGYGNVRMDETTGKVKSILTEHRYGETKPAVVINIDSHKLFATGYRAQVINATNMLK